MKSTARSSIIEDFAALIDSAELAELRLRTPVGGDKYSPEVMAKRTGRPPVGVQGMILDAMDDERITREQAYRLLLMLNARLTGGATVMGKVMDDGSIAPLEAFAHGR